MNRKTAHNPDMAFERQKIAFGSKLHIARRAKKMSRRVLAEACDCKVDMSTILRYEGGVIMPSSDVLLELCKILDVSEDYLLGGISGEDMTIAHVCYNEDIDG